jgi:hypothetical protein
MHAETLGDLGVGQPFEPQQAQDPQPDRVGQGAGLLGGRFSSGPRHEESLRDG